jgi:hypothetical protein
MMARFFGAAGLVLGAAVWFLLFVILGIGLGTAFIAGGAILAAGVVAAAMVAAPVRPILDAPITGTGLLAGVAAFVVMTVVLSSIPIWVAVVTGLSVAGLCSMIDGLLVRPRAAEATTTGLQGTQFERRPGPPASNGRDTTREPVGAR